MTDMGSFPKPGSTASLNIDVTESLIESFAQFSGDRNPLHFDDQFARARGFPGRLAHGMSYGSFLSTLIGMHLPGSGALWLSQAVRFTAPVHVGDRLLMTAQVATSDVRSRIVRLSVSGENQHGRRVLEAECEALLPLARGEQVGTAKESASVPAHGRHVALLAGASGGLGLAIAKALGASGFALGLAGRDQRRLSALATELSADHVPNVCLELDLCSDASVDQAVSRLETVLGAPSLVVHSATAKLENTPLEAISPTLLTRHFEVQAGGMLRLFRRCSTAMLQRQNGQFIYIGTTAMRSTPPKGLGAYTAAKSAGASIARSIALEYAARGIRANIVSPHFLATSLNASTGEKTRLLAAAQVPTRRLALVDEVAAAVAFMAGETARYINGHDLIIDGGVTML
jgi:NAD(P)-dependent dehydrogenase (short-subunit alcohol dehydrogenase family)/acyl dehydratase